jgi:hypothetical protein
VAAINVGAQAGRVSAAELPGRFLARLNEAKAHLRPLIKRAQGHLR